MSCVLEGWNCMIHAAEKQDNMPYAVGVATSDACCAVTAVKCPFGHTQGTSAEGFFSLQEVRFRQTRDRRCLQFCCLKQSKKHVCLFFVVADQQLLIYALENVGRTQLLWEGF